MAEAAWNAFVTKRPGKGHLVSVRTLSLNFRKPSGMSPNNQKQWPTISALVKEAIGSDFKSDWAHISETGSGHAIRNGKRIKTAAVTMYLFAFSDPQDATIAATYLRASSSTPNTAPVPGFVSLITGSEIDMSEYARLAKALRY
ncbi:hypothetical protein [Rhizobium leguminosarum]|uniref:hypothetical protein n=1 Tax=Rhizobium leguminosarum TaxID=384 RepID=UPI0011AEBC26|nr:hypothetical protein [Rhizobium leguminosarum]